MLTHFVWIDHAYESFGHLVFRGEKSKAGIHLTSHNGKTWHAAVVGLWWRGRLLEEEFSTREGAKLGAEGALAKALGDLAVGFAEFLAPAVGAGSEDPGDTGGRVAVALGAKGDPIQYAKQKIEEAHHYLEEFLSFQEAMRPGQASG